MTCPRCGIPFARSLTECSACGFTLAGLRQRLGEHIVVVDRLTDTVHVLRLREAQRIEGLLDEFEHRFPQAYLTIFLGALPAEVTAGEAGFWLLNHGVRTCHGGARDNRFGVALIIDPSTFAAAVSVGYGLEPVLPPAVLFSLLESVSPALFHGDYAAAIRRLVRSIDKVFRRHGTARRRPPPQPQVKTGHLPGFEAADQAAEGEAAIQREPQPLP